MLNKKYTNYLLLAAGIVLFAINEIPFIEDVHPVVYDEVWYANTAYNFAHHNGLYNTVVGAGGNANFVAPVVMGAMMYLFGDSLLVIRLTAVLFGFLTLGILHLIMNRLRCSYKSRIIAYGLFVSLSIVNYVFRSGRPEFASLLFCALGVYAYIGYYNQPTWRSMILLAISCFFAICSHPFTALLFALMGAYLFLVSLCQRHYNQLLQLLLLLLSAIAALLLVQIISKHYNGAVGEENSSILNRLFTTDLVTAIRTYLHSMFVNKQAALVNVPSLCVIVISLFRTDNKAIKSLSVIVMAFVVIFPILFAADLAMIGFASKYLVLIAIIITADLCRMLFEQYQVYTYYIYVSVLGYCLFNLCFTYYLNYGVYYERANSILAKDIDVIIPDSAVVFGQMSQWPCKMHSRYSSELKFYDMNKSYDWVITNSQNLSWRFQGFLSQIELYEPVYTRNTKQYGEVVVYKRK